MKKITVAFIVASFMLVTNTFGSPLIFKGKKPIDSPDEFAELFTFDTSKQQRLRLYIDIEPGSQPIYSILVQAIEDGESIVIYNETSELRKAARINTIIEVPPSKTRINVKGKGTFRVFVWGQ